MMLTDTTLDFLWTRDPLDINSPFDIYIFKVALFGSTCSQYLLNATIDHHLNNIKDQDNIIADIRRGLYIDNLQGTSSSEKDLIYQYWQVQQIFNKAHLYLRGWVTNSISLQQLRFNGDMAKDPEQVKVLVGPYCYP